MGRAKESPWGARGVAVRMRTRLGRARSAAQKRAVHAWCAARVRLGSESGQGTTEYAILVGVLVVIAIIAITLFRPKIEELWNAIAEGINGL